MKKQPEPKKIKWYVCFEILDIEIEEMIKQMKASKKLDYQYSWKGADWYEKDKV